MFFKIVKEFHNEKWKTVMENRKILIKLLKIIFTSNGKIDHLLF